MRVFCTLRVASNRKQLKAKISITGSDLPENTGNSSSHPFSINQLRDKTDLTRLNFKMIVESRGE